LSFVSNFLKAHLTYLNLISKSLKDFYFVFPHFWQLLCFDFDFSCLARREVNYTLQCIKLVFLLGNPIVACVHLDWDILREFEFYRPLWQYSIEVSNFKVEKTKDGGILVIFLESHEWNNRHIFGSIYFKPTT